MSLRSLFARAGRFVSTVLEDWPAYKVLTLPADLADKVATAAIEGNTDVGTVVRRAMALYTAAAKLRAAGAPELYTSGRRLTDEELKASGLARITYGWDKT